MPKYDSTLDTKEHIAKVQEYISQVREALFQRAHDHDKSKLSPEEKPFFDDETSNLKNLVFGSDEYKASLARLKPALDHHYSVNDHHPEHFEAGINGMHLIQIVEMWCDWVAASQRNQGGRLNLDHLKQRFEISDQLLQIFVNTAQVMGLKYDL